MHATFRRLRRSAGRLHSARKWLFPDWEQIEWKVSSSSGCRTSPEQKSLQRFADPDGSRRAKTRSSWSSGTRRHRRPGEEFLAGLFHCRSTFSVLRLAWFLFFYFFFSAPVWISTGVVRSAFTRSASKTLPACVYIHPPSRETRRERDVYTERHKSCQWKEKKSAESTSEVVGKSVSAINSIDTKVWYRYRMDTWGIVIQFIIFILFNCFTVLL